jgi:hypothetical protein
MIVKKTCSGLGKAITAALLIFRARLQDNVRNPMNNAVSNSIVGLNLIFITF